MEIIIFPLMIFLLYYFVVKPKIINPFREGLHETKKPTQKNTSSIKKTNSQNNNESDDLKIKGDAFEHFIVKKFDRKYFIIHEWRGDKFADGVYAESSKNPDFEIEYTWNNISSRFAVECKYRSKIYEDVIIADQRKIDHYKKYSYNKRIPVFIALGLGGHPQRPEECYVIPLKFVQGETIDYEDLQRFRRYNPDKDFFYDYYNSILS